MSSVLLVTGPYCDFLMLCKIYTQDEVEVPVTSWAPKGERKEEGRDGKKREGRRNGGRKSLYQPCLHRV